MLGIFKLAQGVACFNNFSRGAFFTSALVAVIASGPVAARAGTAGQPGQLAPEFAIADFDGDSRPDMASVQIGQGNSRNTRYSIALQLSNGPRQTVSVTAPSGGLRLTSRDVNGDHFLDLIVTTAWQQRPVAVLLNDGHGSFTVRDPALFLNTAVDSDRSWAPAYADIKDAAAALLTQGFSASCDAPGRAMSAHISLQLRRTESSSSLRCWAIASVFGRAPPNDTISA